MSFVPISEILEKFAMHLKNGDLCHCQCGFVERGDSVLEERFWHMLRKTMKGWHGAADQFQIGRYRVDALIDCDGKAVVVELDGKQFHDVNADRVRDAEILKSVDAIIRIPFAAMWYYHYGSMVLLAEWFPRFQMSGIPLTVISADELDAERSARRDDLYLEQTEDDWLADANDCLDVWKCQGDLGLIGTPKQFLFTTPKIQITLQHGQGATPGILENLYERAQCKIGIEYLRNVA